MSEYKDYGYEKDSFSHAHAYILPVLENLLDTKRNKKILDVGCGNGAVARLLIQKGFDVYGTDASEQGIGIAKNYHPDRFFLQDLSKDGLPNELESISFDTIISTEVVEHLYDPRKYVAFCKSVLQKNGGGEFLLSTPYNGYVKNIALSLFDKWDFHLNPLWDGGHIKFWSKKTLTKLLEEHSFQVVEFKGAGRFPYLWKSMIIKARL